MTVQVAREGSTAVVTLSGASSRNAFDSSSIALIAATLNGLMDDSEVRSIVLTGTDRVFSVSYTHLTLPTIYSV